MVKTLSQVSASFAFSFGAFAVPLAIFLTGSFHHPAQNVLEMTPSVSAAPMAALPLADLPMSEVRPATTASGSSGEGAAMSVTTRTEVGARRQDARVVSNSASVAAKKKKKKCLADNPDIARLDAATYAVERSVIKYYGRHLRELNRLGYAATYKVDGKSTGFVVRGIQCGNDLHQAGIRNGDVIHAVNGKSVTNIPQALAAYATLKGNDVLTLSISRMGSGKQMIYRLS